MGKVRHAGAWKVSFATKRASCGEVVVSFRPCGEEGFSITFLSGTDCAVEEQCTLAGEAIAAIQAALLNRRR